MIALHGERGGDVHGLAGVVTFAVARRVPSITAGCTRHPASAMTAGMQSMSDPSAMTGPPRPQVAHHDDGIPDTPRLDTGSRSFSRIVVKYLCVSNS